MMDVVYPYKRTPGDVELRYSLRSLSNMPHGRVIVAGDKPKCINRNVVHVPVRRISDRYKSSTANILAAAEAAVETNQFIVMNDDIFILEPWTFRHENRGTIEEYLASGTAQGLYRTHVEWTRDILVAHGIKEPLWFGLHTPTVYERTKLIELVKDFKGERYLLRTLYHNIFPQPSRRREDVKRREWRGEPTGDVLSINDQCAWLPAFRAWVSKRFPQPSPYEVPSKA